VTGLVVAERVRSIPAIQIALALALGLGIALLGVSSQTLLIAAGGGAVLLAFGVVRPTAFVVVAFATLSMPRLHAPGSPLPINELMLGMTFLVLVMSARGTRRRTPPFFVVGMLSLVAALMMSAVINALINYEASKRVAHVVLFVAVSLAIANGFIPFRAVVRGLLIGLLTATAFGVLALTIGFGSGDYAGRLSGLLFGEPNFAGFMFVACGPIVAMNIERRAYRFAFVAMAVVAVGLTFSRTSFLAVLLVGVWLLLGRRVQPAIGLTLIAALVIAVALLPAEIHTTGPFATRVGSDNLRARIFEKETASIAQAPVLGHGPGTATVELPGQAPFRFYFHSSYYALVQEGGAVALVLLVGVILTLFFRLTSLPVVHRSPWLESSLIAVVVCGLTLGEVLLEMGSAIAIGAAVRYLVIHSKDASERELDDATSRPTPLDA